MRGESTYVILLLCEVCGVQIWHKNRKENEKKETGYGRKCVY